MGSEAAAAVVVVVGELPLLPPIKTAPSPPPPPPPIRPDRPAEDGRSTSPAAAEREAEECVTPRSEEHVLKPVLACPPAPRKPRPARRTPAVAPPSKEFCAVPRDLAAVFLPLPPKKRIRVV